MSKVGNFFRFRWVGTAWKSTEGRLPKLKIGKAFGLLRRFGCGIKNGGGAAAGWVAGKVWNFFKRRGRGAKGGIGTAAKWAWRKLPKTRKGIMGVLAALIVLAAVLFLISMWLMGGAGTRQFIVLTLGMAVLLLAVVALLVTLARAALWVKRRMARPPRTTRTSAQQLPAQALMVPATTGIVRSGRARNMLIKGIVCLLMVYGAVLASWYLYFCQRWLAQLCGGVALGLVVLFFAIKGFVMVPEEERWIIEFFGAYYRTLKPGPHWLLPFFESLRGFISVWIQRYPLFEKPINIDFIDGAATPKEVMAFVQCNEFDDIDAPRKMAYEVKDVKGATVSLLENACRSYLNHMTIDEALQEGKGGFNILTRMDQDKLDDIGDQLRGWGLKLLRTTIGDFDLDNSIVKARESVAMSKYTSSAAVIKRQQKAQEAMGVLIEMVAYSQKLKPSTIQKEIRKDSDLKEAFMGAALDLTRRQMSIDGKSFSDIRVSGGEEISSSLVAALASLLTKSKPTIPIIMP